MVLYRDQFWLQAVSLTAAIGAAAVIVPRIQLASNRSYGDSLAEGRKYTDENFTGQSIDLSGLTGENHRSGLVGALLRDAELSGACADVDFSRADLSESSIDVTTFSDCRFHYTEFTNATLSGKKKHVETSTFRKAKFYGAQLSKIKFVHCGMEYSSWNGATVTDCEFEAVRFNGADLRGSTFDRSDFKAIDLRGANLEGADFTTSTFESATVLTDDATVWLDIPADAIVKRCVASPPRPESQVRLYSRRAEPWFVMNPLTRLRYFKNATLLSAVVLLFGFNAVGPNFMGESDSSETDEVAAGEVDDELTGEADGSVGSDGGDGTGADPGEDDGRGSELDDEPSNEQDGDLDASGGGGAIEDNTEAEPGSEGGDDEEIDGPAGGDETGDDDGGDEGDESGVEEGDSEGGSSTGDQGPQPPTQPPGTSTTTTTTQPPQVPSEPRNIDVAERAERLVVSWSAPASEGTGSIVGYRAVARPGGASCQATAKSDSCVIRGLVANTEYTVNVAAFSEVGQGDFVRTNATPLAVKHEIVVRARGAEGDERFKVLLGGTIVGEGTAGASYKNFEFRVDPEMGGFLTVSFDNDYSDGAGVDRTLWVDHVVVDGTTYQAEHQRTYASGVWQPGRGCVSGNLASEQINCEGSLTFTEVLAKS